MITNLFTTLTSRFTGRTARVAGTARPEAPSAADLQQAQHAKLRRLNDVVRDRVRWSTLEEIGAVAAGTDPSDLLGLTVRPFGEDVFVMAGIHGPSWKIEDAVDEVHARIGAVLDTPHALNGYVVFAPAKHR